MKYIVVFAFFAFLALAALCERAEQKSRKYYLDQWCLRGSGFCFGVAVTLLWCVLVNA